MRTSLSCLRRHIVIGSVGLMVACGSDQQLEPRSEGHSPSSSSAVGSLQEESTSAAEPEEPATADEDNIVPQAEEGDCGMDRMTYRYDNKKGVRWVATKTKIIPVVGEQEASVILQESGTGAGKQFAMRVDFNPTSLNSGVTLRDQRIRTFVFGEGEREKTELSFLLKDIYSKDLFEIPPVGETVKVTFQGILSVAGQPSELSIPAYVTGTSEGLRITNGNDELRINLRDQLHLDDRVDKLMALVNTTMENNISVRFDWKLKNVCQ